jgi:hypothetical protein
MSVTTQSTTPATLPAGTKLALDTVGTASAPTTGDGLGYTKIDVGAAGATSPVTAANPLPTVASLQSDTTASAPLAALNATVLITLNGQRGCGLQIPVASTLVGTLTPELSYDGGTTWVSTFFDNAVTGSKTLTQVTASGVAYALTIVLGGGSSHARVWVSAFTSGTATAALRASTSADPSVLFTQAIGQPVLAGNPVALNGVQDAAGLAAVLRGTSVAPTSQEVGLVVRNTPRAADTVLSVTGAASAAVTATLPAAGAGLFHYITRINIMKYATVATTGSATPAVVTSTNLPGSLAWTTPTALAVGTQYETDVQGSSPLRSSVSNTGTTFVAPIATSIIWRINVYYFTGT